MKCRGMIMNRTAGILLPITSLPSKYGIGGFSKSAYDFVDWLKEAGQCYWQILPLVPTSYGDSPYQSFSTYAGNPYFIDLDALIEEGVLTEEEVTAEDWGSDPSDIDYEKIYNENYGHSGTTWVGCPYVEFNPEIKTEDGEIRQAVYKLKFTRKY